MARARPCLLRYGRFIWSRPKRQAQHCLPFLFPLYRLPYARYGFAIQRKFCSQLNRPRRSANKADSGSGYGRLIWKQTEKGKHNIACLFFIPDAVSLAVCSIRLRHTVKILLTTKKTALGVVRTRRTAAAGTDGLFGAEQKSATKAARLLLFVRLSPQIRTDFPQTCRGESRFARQAEVKWVVEGCFSVSLAKSSVFSRRRKTRQEHIVFRGAMTPTDLRKNYSWRIAVSVGRGLVSRRNYTVLSKPSPVGEGGTRRVRDKASISRRT